MGPIDGARRRGSLMVREVGFSTNLAFWLGFMAATSQTMVKWSTSFEGGRDSPDQRHLPAGEEVMARKWRRDFSGRVCKSMSDRKLYISTSSACLQDFLAEGCVWGVLG